MKRILGMGNALLDVLVELRGDQLLLDLQLPKGSMTLIDQNRLDIVQESIDGLKFTQVSGGSAANTIHGLAALGIPSGFIGSVGPDTQGDFFINDLKEKGISCHFMRALEPSGRATALISQDSERTFATYLGAALSLHPAFINAEQFQDYDIFHIEGYLVQKHSLIQKAVKLAHESGCLVSLDLASYNIVEEDKEFLDTIIEPYVDILFANEDEARAFTGREPKQAAEDLAVICREVIIKMGKNGAILRSGDEEEVIDAFPAKPLDTTGAGDLFAAGYLYGLSMGLPLHKRGRIGSLLAARVIEDFGPKIKINDWPDLLARIKQIQHDV